MGALSGRGLGSRLARPKSRLRRPAPKTGEDPALRSRDWLNTARWRRLRLKVLDRDDFTCQQTGVLLVGKHPAPDSPVVDHIRPHRGNAEMFWDETNLQAVSKAWHDSVKQSMERRGLA